MNPQSRRESGRPVVDETAFQQLLSAAYVMQEHNNRLKKAPQAATQVTVPVAAAAKSTLVANTSTPQFVPFPAAAQPTNSGSNCQECG